MAELTSNAEKLAEEAESFLAFSGLKLAHIKDQLEKLLALIGREGIFDEYTQHDISHIDKMLSILDWLVPEDTKRIMSPADWLMTVLGIYFHDLGMLVTKREYDARESSGFPEFRDTVLFDGEKGEDYRVKVESLGPDRGERFAYQEFVRANHAGRIRSWVLGQDQELLGISTEIVAELNELLRPFTLQFRRDLSLICESHHLSDLDNFAKYKVSQPYGDSDEETVNLQYAAVLLRTADLLHITSDRTPSISYRVINPTDPVSQNEWSKQRAVTRVRSRVGLDIDKNPDETAPRHAIEVHAHFTEQDGFFGLTSYLHYTEDQLQKSYDWVAESNKSQGAKHKFPWRSIDDTHIATEGFIKETFEFTFDQARILDLLTGHTLYNDVNIVLRELVQNSIDAIRLQELIETRSGTATFSGSVKIGWNSAERVLSVEDNGTGMTQSIIERNLLKVGSSRYQGEEFKAEFPSFSPISRFGIGVLSTFMIADSVEIVTCHPEENEARHLSLRSVHGKYLIRLLNKQLDPEVKSITPHGTQIKLKVRHSVNLSDIVQTARRWIVIPGCDVHLAVDDGEPVPIGFQSAKEAVKGYLLSSGYELHDFDGGKPKIKIIEESESNITLAYALTWSAYFKEWAFMRLPRNPLGGAARMYRLGTCVEGIRVEFNTPGFVDYEFIAISNAEGLNAPKTNVARSGLEHTPEREQMLDIIYRLYCRHITKEIDALYKKRAFSLTWAVGESRFLLSPLTSPRSQLLNKKAMISNLTKLPLVLVERKSERQAISIDELRQDECFWTIECASFTSAESLLREIPGSSSLTSLINSLGSQDFGFPDQSLICGIRPDLEFDSLAFDGKEVELLRINREQRRVDLKWTTQSDPRRWRTFLLPLSEPALPTPLSKYEDREIRKTFEGLHVGQGLGIGVEGSTNEVGVLAFNSLYLLPDRAISKLLSTGLDQLQKSPSNSRTIQDTFLLFYLASSILAGAERLPIDLPKIRRLTSKFRPSIDEEMITPQLLDIFNDTDWTIFNPSVWSRAPEVSP